MWQRLFVFHGDYQNAHEWLTIADQHVIIRDKGHEKIQVVSCKLDSKAFEWFSQLPMGFKKHWDIFRELFVAKWVDRLGEVEMKEKRLALLQRLNPLEAGTLALDVFFTVPEVEPDMRPATEGEKQREENGVPSFSWADDVDTTAFVRAPRTLGKV
ncbi:hypothetical protein BKA82DRAFT_30480 [Pisolithus tinctorius]|uniref:Retrotransposon gag domain-containing protein n=1 Tax=Pisolithus tinctorius Marx 270 TaxID=870435 RepID=A0A0C3JPM1_PISTI|nr:hypothetical protein BKA82DRAFT_30480 [Pisolithus tinctorius]KIN99431.1 hypothetical protein M404DRAFT_30480 [Pisolithus tinctorius Marx 270]